MAMDTSKVHLPLSMTTYIKENTKGTSTIAALCTATPQLFTDSEHMIFNGDSEAEVVEEGQVKSSYDQDVSFVTGKRFKVQTTTRVTDELRWADEDNRLQIVDAIQADQVAALGRALDYVVYHGINPKPGTVMSKYDKLSETAQQVTATGNPIDDIDAMVDALIDHDVNGVAISKRWASQMRKLRNGDGTRLFPDVPISLNVGELEGIAASTSATVNGSIAKTPTKVLAFMGDYSMIKWGFVRDIWAEVIPYGDPDNTGVDLKSVNQVAYRTEAVYAYTVIDPTAFAVLKEA